MQMTEDERTLARIVGSATFRRGREYADAGHVRDVEVAADCDSANGRVLGSLPYRCDVEVTWSAAGSLQTFLGDCSCPVGQDCKHCVALVLCALLDGEARPAPAPTAPVVSLLAPWEQALRRIVAAPDEPERDTAVGLQFQLLLPSGAARPHPVVHLRPVLPGPNGRWVRTGISWSDLQYAAYRLYRADPDHVRLLQEIALFARGTASYYSYASRSPLDLTAVDSRRIWNVLEEAVELGLPLVATADSPAPVLMVEPADVTLDLTRAERAMALRPLVTLDAQAVPLETAVLIGTEAAHGIAWWGDGPGAEGALRLARFAEPVAAELRHLMTPTPMLIDETHRERFFTRYFPGLRERVTLSSSDASVELPESAPPVLALTVQHAPGHRADLRWQWQYRLGDMVRSEPLHASGPRPVGRDLSAERERLEEVQPAAKAVPDLWEQPDRAGASTGHRRLRASSSLSGMALVRFLADVLPQLREVPDLVVDVVGEPADYREAESAPLVQIDGAPAESGRDWFDLAVTVTVDDEPVPFELLFSALALGQTELILPSGTWFTLDRPEFRVLADLIAEARSLQDHDGETLRLSRYQASFWAELEEIGVVTGQALEWQRQVAGLVDVETMEEPPLPVGLTADLRPYQRLGFSWLSFLYRHGLGGVLADEMGLGKTLQALALFTSAREARPDGAPFLVVAPTSVVPNWASECRRFAPGLTVRTVAETKARRTESLADIAADADVLVTSYTLFRLENEHYRALDWSGMVLDEAQFVKNHKAKAYACARMLPAPFKLAITGTPMENNLMELWSLLSITAPGLFSNPSRFEQTYRNPIEKERDTELLGRLRRRVKPLMLRRSKEEVAGDLPAKQEQVLELPMNPKHRKVYQTHLQRERQKVLGLLGDLEKNRFEVFRSLTLLRQASLDAALIDPRYADIPSTKLDHLAEQLDEITREGHRVLVFSQFTRFLGAARTRTESAGIAHCYLDGKTRDRAAVLDRFKSGDAPVFFVSLKAGGFGLNQTEADYCILLDPWWNPAAEAQAVDRVHRIGQTKQVMVYRLVAKETIEEKVMALKASKSALFDSVMDGGDFGGGALTAEDISGMLE